MARQKFVHFVPRPKPRKRPGRHTKNLNKSKKRSYKKYNRQGRWQILLNDYPIVMKEKTITIKINQIIRLHNNRMVGGIGNVVSASGVNT